MTAMSLDYGTCGHCDFTGGVTADGVMCIHGPEDGVVCPGSGSKPVGANVKRPPREENVNSIMASRRWYPKFIGTRSGEQLWVVHSYDENTTLVNGRAFPDPFVAIEEAKKWVDAGRPGPAADERVPKFAVNEVVILREMRRTNLDHLEGAYAVVMGTFGREYHLGVVGSRLEIRVHEDRLAKIKES